MTNLKSARTQLVKETMQFARTMSDIEVLARRQWQNGAGKGSVQEYIDQSKLQSLFDGFQMMAKAIEAIHTDINQMEAKQTKQDINIVKAGRAKLRVISPIVDEIVKETELSSDLVHEWIKDVKIIDPTIYTKGKRIYYATIGLSARDIQYNEFDLEFASNTEFDVSDLEYIRENWPTFSQKVKEYTGNTLSEFVRTYAQRRGVEFVAKKRGPKGPRKNKNTEAI